MNTRPTLLIVSYHFAPSPLVGAKRFSFLTREFTRQGYDVHVITHEVRDSPHGRADSSLPLHGTVHRVTAAYEPVVMSHGPARATQRTPWQKLQAAAFRRVLAPVGPEYFWSRAAVRKALEIARGLPRGVVIATSPPASALLAGGAIARQLGWPLILDYRDPWSAYDWPDWHRGGLAQWIATRLESRLVRQSAARVLNTPDMRKWFERWFPFAPRPRNQVVPNGFDSVPAGAAPPEDGPLRILHAGEVYGSRSLVPLLRAIQRLETRHPERPIRVTTFGHLPTAEWQRIRDAGLDHLVDERARVPFAALFPELQRAHVLLALVSEHMTYSTPYKVYDYMAAGRPILGLAPRGAALRELLADSGAGDSADAQDIGEIEAALERCLFGAAPARDGRIEEFRWSHLARRYRALIDEVREAAGGASGEGEPNPAPDTIRRTY